MTARTPIASTVPQPHGKPGGPGAFHIKGASMPPYIEHVAGELLKKGKTKAQAYRMAIGIVRNWANGHNRGHAVSAEVQAAARKAVAQYDALRARAKATPNKGHEHTAARESVELAKPTLTDRSGMIALEVPDGTLPRMPGGMTDHHVTLAYLGDDVDDAGYAKAIKAAKHAASRHGPLAGQLGGIGAFPPGDDGTPVWATVDVPGLAELRHTLVQHMGGHASEHGYTPHATLTYVKPGQPMPKPLPPTNVKFSHVSVHRGNQIVRIPLAGGHQHTEERMTVDLAWNPSQHPRAKAGSGAGGQFVPLSKGSGYATKTHGRKKRQVTAVKVVQSLLNRRGVKDKNGKHLAVDGYYGPLTTSAVKRFQAHHGLHTTGKVDRATLAALRKGAPKAGSKTEGHHAKAKPKKKAKRTQGPPLAATMSLSNQVEWGRGYAAQYARARVGEPYVWSGHDDGGMLPVGVELAKDYVEATRLKDGTPAPPGVMKTRGGHVVKKKPKLGTGARFAALVAKLEARGHSHESAVKIAAAIGRRKYGAKKMGALSHHHTTARESVELSASRGSILLAPNVRGNAIELGRHTFRKQILPIGDITYRPSDGPPRKLSFTRDYLAGLATAFRDEAFDAVPFVLADSGNRHTMEPERARGEVTGLELTESGLDAIVTLSDDAAALVRDHPKLGVSARIVERLERADGKSWPAAIQHVLGTWDPRITGMAPWEAVELSTSGESVVDLSSEVIDLGKEEDMSGPLTDEETTTLAGLLGKLGYKLEPASSTQNDDTGTDDDLVGEELTADELDELLATLEGGDDEGFGEFDDAEGDLAGAELSEDAREAIELANARASEADNRVKAMEVQLAEQRWQQERSRYEEAGVTPVVLDLARPLLSQPGESAIELSNGESVTPAAVVRKILAEVAAGNAHVDLSRELGTGVDNTEDDPAAKKRAEVLANWPE